MNERKRTIQKRISTIKKEKAKNDKKDVKNILKNKDSININSIGDIVSDSISKIKSGANNNRNSNNSDNNDNSDIPLRHLSVTVSTIYK